MRSGRGSMNAGTRPGICPASRGWAASNVCKRSRYLAVVSDSQASSDGGSPGSQGARERAGGPERSSRTEVDQHRTTVLRSRKVGVRYETSRAHLGCRVCLLPLSLSASPSLASSDNETSSWCGGLPSAPDRSRSSSLCVRLFCHFLWTRPASFPPAVIFPRHSAWRISSSEFSLSGTVSKSPGRSDLQRSNIAGLDSTLLRVRLTWCTIGFGMSKVALRLSIASFSCSFCTDRKLSRPSVASGRRGHPQSRASASRLPLPDVFGAASRRSARLFSTSSHSLAMSHELLSL